MGSISGNWDPARRANQKKKKIKRLRVKTSCGRVEDNFTGGDESELLEESPVWIWRATRKVSGLLVDTGYWVWSWILPGTQEIVYMGRRGSGQRLKQEAVVNDSRRLKLDVLGNRAREWTINSNNSNIDKNWANYKCKVYLFLPCVCMCVCAHVQSTKNKYIKIPPIDTVSCKSLDN